MIYYGDETDRARFARLREQALNVDGPSAWHDRARREFSRAYHPAYLVETAATLTDARLAAVDLVKTLSFAIAQWNLTTIKRGMRLLKSEILAMPDTPAGFDAAYDAVFAANDVAHLQAACRALVDSTAAMLAGNQSAEPVMGAFAGWYEEMIQYYNKIAHAGETGDPYTPLLAAVDYTAELNSLLRRTGIDVALPDMVAAYDSRDLSVIVSAAWEHQQRFETFLTEHEYIPRRFASMDEVAAFLSRVPAQSS